MKLFLLLLSLVVSGFLFAASVQAVTFSQDTTLQVTVNGAVNSFTIEAGSVADEFVGNTSSFQVTVSPGQNFVVNSSNKKTFDNNSGYTTHCSTGQSAIAIAVAQGEPAKTVIVTPSGDTCALAASGGSSSGGSSTGGAGSSGASSTTTPVPTPTPIAYTTPAPTYIPTTSGGTTLKITIASLNVRNSPVSGKVVSKVRLNEIYTFTATQNGWYKIQKNGQDLGWVSGLYIKVNNVAVPVPTPKPASGTVKVVATVKFLNVRSTSSTVGKIVTKVLPSESYTFTATQNGWYKIQKNGQDLGWVSGIYVTVK